MKKKSSKIDNKVKQSFEILFSEVDELISELKSESSEEILNGSVVKAQELLSRILPYETFHNKLIEAKSAFDEIKHESEDQETIDTEVVNQKEVDDEVKKQIEPDETDEYTSQEKFRIPLLKALIYLGGNAQEADVIEFVEKDMKPKLLKLDFEIPDGEEKERWLSSLYFETATMMDEGLLNSEASKKKWEINQKGIDYLGKYAK